MMAQAPPKRHHSRHAAPPPARLVITTSRAWEVNFEGFRARHRCSSFLQVDPLYLVPRSLLKLLVTNLTGWLSGPEIVFETEFQELCQRHHCIGIWQGRPVRHLLLGTAPLRAPSAADIAALGWEHCCTPDKARDIVDVGNERLSHLHDRLEARTGWLMTNPEFLRDRDRLKAKWREVVADLGQIPSYPVRLGAEFPSTLPPRARDVTAEFIEDFNHFFDQWELDHLATWDLPVPRGGNLSGLPLPASATPLSAVTLQLSPALALPSDFPLREVIAEAQQAALEQSSCHNSRAASEGWFAVTKNKHQRDLSFNRFRKMFRLIHYRYLVLKSRYADRFRGHMEDLDAVFGLFVDSRVKQSADSIKKLRRTIDVLRQDC